PQPSGSPGQTSNLPRTLSLTTLLCQKRLLLWREHRKTRALHDILTKRMPIGCTFVVIIKANSLRETYCRLSTIVDVKETRRATDTATVVVPVLYGFKFL